MTTPDPIEPPPARRRPSARPRHAAAGAPPGAAAAGRLGPAGPDRPRAARHADRLAAPSESRRDAACAIGGPRRRAW